MEAESEFKGSFSMGSQAKAMQAMAASRIDAHLYIKGVRSVGSRNESMAVPRYPDILNYLDYLAIS